MFRLFIFRPFHHFKQKLCPLSLESVQHATAVSEYGGQTATSSRVALTRQLPAFYPQFKVSVRDGLDTPIFLPVTAYADALTCPGLKSSNAAEPFKGRKIRSYP